MAILRLVLCVLPILFTAGWPTASALAQERSRSLATTVPLSFGINAAQISGQGDDLEGIASCGAKYVRHSAHWSAIERRKGVFDFGKHREFYDAAKARGIRVVFILAYGNRLYEPSRRREIVSDRGRDAFAAFAAAAASHFRGDDVIWEIWNEPNTKNFWGGTANSQEIAEEYAKLLRATVPAMRQADPQCTIVAGSVSCLWPPSFAWMRNVLQQDVLDGLDGWSVHPYGLKTPEDSIAAYETTRSLLREFNQESDAPPLLNTERGFSFEEIAEVVGSSPEAQEAHQARLLVRQYLVDLMSDVRLTIWYAWKDDEFGMMDGDRRRPVCQASRVVTEQLNRYAFSRRLTGGSPNDYLAVFERDGNEMLVAWTTSAPHEVHLAFVGDATSIDSCGMLGDAQSIPIRNGELVLELSEAPCYLDLGAGRVERVPSAEAR